MPKKSKPFIDGDVKVLHELQKNSNNSIDAIAKLCGCSRQKVWRIIKQLENSNIIWGYTAIVDEHKRDLEKYLLLLKKSSQTLDGKTIDEIAGAKFENDYIKMGITLESSYYLHGDYDWAIIFTSQDLKQAKKFSNLLLENYPQLISKINLLRILYTQRTSNIVNPQASKLREFY
jgi:Lrp/AsnC family leucine-responsive transcriptional regulator